MALALSANIRGSDKVFIVGGRSFMYITKSNNPRIEPWGLDVYIPACGAVDNTANLQYRLCMF